MRILRSTVPWLVMLAACKSGPSPTSPTAPPPADDDCALTDDCAQAAAPVANIRELFNDSREDEDSYCGVLYLYARDALEGFHNVRTKAGTQNPSVFGVGFFLPDDDGGVNCYIHDDANSVESASLTCELLGFGDGAAATAALEANTERVTACLVADRWTVAPGSGRVTTVRPPSPNLPAFTLATKMSDSGGSFTTTIVVQLVTE